MKIAVIPASIEDKSVMRNMFELYIYDFSEMTGWDLDEHGLFGYRYLDQYWAEAERYPFLVRVDGKLGGFALVRVAEDGAEPVTSMAEFFILRKFRRRGVGELVATEVFRRFPGAWSVHQIAENVAAQVFWRRVIGQFTGGAYEERTEPAAEGVWQTFRVGG